MNVARISNVQNDALENINNRARAACCSVPTCCLLRKHFKAPVSKAKLIMQSLFVGKWVNDVTLIFLCPYGLTKFKGVKNTFDTFYDKLTLDKSIF